MDGVCEICGQQRQMGRADCGHVGVHETQEPNGGDYLDQTIVRPYATNPAGPPLLVVDDGTRIPIAGSLLLGRAPRSELGSASVVLPDDGMTISKTHVRIAAFDGGVAVTDLRSTNGVRVILPEGQDYWLEPGRPEVLTAGARFQLGARLFTVTDADGNGSGPMAGVDGGSIVPITDWPMVRSVQTQGGVSLGANALSPGPSAPGATAQPDAGGQPQAAEGHGRRRRAVSAAVLAMVGGLAVIVRDPVIAVVGLIFFGAAIHLFIGGRTKTHAT